MPPARVLIFSNQRLEAELMKENPLVGIDLPLRALAYESEPGGDSKIIYNSIEFIKSRYGLNSTAEVESAYKASMSKALQGIGAEQVVPFNQESMNPVWRACSRRQGDEQSPHPGTGCFLSEVSGLAG